MATIKAKVGGVWVPVGGGSTDEVFIGPDTPTDTNTELWYDTDEPNLADPDTARWNSAWGVIAVGTLTIGDGQQWTNQAALTNLLTVNGMSSARRYKVYLRIRALAGGTTFTYNMPLKIDGASTAISSERHGQVIGSAGDSYTQVHADWLIQQVSDGSHTFQVIYSGPNGPTGYGIGGEFYVEDVGPRALASSPPAQPASVWTNMTFLNGWSNYSNGFQPGQYRLVGDVVELRGLVQRTAATTPPSVICTLPVGFRPPARLIASAYGAATTFGMSRIDVQSTGDMSYEALPSGGSGAVGFVTLDAIQYSVSA